MTKQKKFLLFFLLIFAIFYGNYVFAFEIPIGYYPKIPFTNPITENSRLPDFIVYFFALGISLAGAISVISLAIGGVQLVFSSVSPEARSNAIDRIKSAILGLILVLASFIIVRTINPALESVDVKTDLVEVGGLHLKGTGGETTAPMSASDTSTMLQKYSEITWPENVMGMDGKPKKNCDQNSGQYAIYFYKNKNFKKLFNKPQFIKCGGSVSIQGNSFYIKKESPGVYFYSLQNCELQEDDNLPSFYQKSMPEGGRNFKSMRVVNGDDEYLGPFFGVVLHNDANFIGSAFAHFFPSFKIRSLENTGGRCVNFPIIYDEYNISIPGESFTIYKWVGFDENKNPLSAGYGGVILYSWKNFRGGVYQINASTMGSGTEPWQINLRERQIFYPPGNPVSEEEQKECNTFVSSQYSGLNDVYCLKSLEIRGNYLVLLYNGNKRDPLNKLVWASNQRFPISPELEKEYSERPAGYSLEKGTPDLNMDWINNTWFNKDSGKATWVEVVPIAERLTQ